MAKHGVKISGHLLTSSTHLKQKMPGSSILQEGAENETSKRLQAQLLEPNKEETPTIILTSHLMMATLLKKGF